MLRKKRTLTLMLTAIVVAMLISSCTIVRIDEEQSEGGDEYSTWTKTGTGFQASEYVEEIWETKMVPIYESESTDYVTIITALSEDREANSDKYGLLRETGEPFYIFKISGRGKVVEYDDSSRVGTISVDHDGDDIADAILQVGPVFKGTVLRDSVDFISFTEVGNQVQFADLAKQMNLRMNTDSLELLDLTTITGKTIEYLGAFRLETEQPLDEIVISPLTVDLVEE